MRGIWMVGAAGAAAALITGCVATPQLSGTFGAPSFAALQAMCGVSADYDDDAASVYSAFYDAYVAYRRGRLSKDDYCAFQASVAQHHAQLSAGGADARAAWATFFNGERVRAIDWREPTDPTLRGG
ncbi:MAG TPA: hypothetical protein VGZ01_11795 [Trinickia sp.]|nr:hypothetical protein [Trinickia sp.]